MQQVYIWGCCVASSLMGLVSQLAWANFGGNRLSGVCDGGGIFLPVIGLILLAVGGHNEASRKLPLPPLAGITWEHLAGSGLDVGARHTWCRRDWHIHCINYSGRIYLCLAALAYCESMAA